MKQKKQFHICLNLIADPNWHGGNIYIYNVIHALSNLPPEERERIKLSIATRQLNDVPDEVTNKVDKIYRDSIFHLLFYKLLKMLPGFMRSSLFNFRKINFYYPPGNLPRKWIFKWAGWIPDFQYRYLPQLFSKEEYDSREKRNLFLAEQSNVLAFSSQCALDDYVKFFSEYKNNAHLLRFVSNANPAWFNENPLDFQAKYQLPDRFFIVCNQFWKHKDHGTIIDAIHLLKQQGINITAVCTGAIEDFRNPDYYPDLLKKAESLGVKDQFVVIGFIPRKDQIQLIRRSLAIIQPSLFEGWSTVVEDGRSLGKDIFLSNFPVHLEQNPPYARFFAMQDAVQLAALIKEGLPMLSPGPDNIKEEKALQENRQMMADFGRRIIEMAHLAAGR
jgi:glycosyltransferase involved in cell wall biosynthesis